MRPLTDDDFPIVARGHEVYRRTESSPVCACQWRDMAIEIADRLNRDHAASQSGKASILKKSRYWKADIDTGALMPVSESEWRE